MQNRIDDIGVAFKTKVHGENPKAFLLTISLKETEPQAVSA